MAAAALRYTAGHTLRRATATPASSGLSSSASGRNPASDNTRMRMMHSGGGRRGYSGSPAGEWEWTDAYFAAPAAAGMAVYGYVVWPGCSRRRSVCTRVQMEEQEMIPDRIRDGSGTADH